MFEIDENHRKKIPPTENAGPQPLDSRPKLPKQNPIVKTNGQKAIIIIIGIIRRPDFETRTPGLNTNQEIEQQFLQDCFETIHCVPEEFFSNYVVLPFSFLSSDF